MSSVAPDANCITLPDGSCVGTEGCMHNPDFDQPSARVVPCCMCGKPTTWDPTYEDLCYRCIRADNE